MAFDSIQVKFKNVTHFKSPLANTIEVPFVDSYLTVLNSVISQIKTEYFWFFASRYIGFFILYNSQSCNA